MNRALILIPAALCGIVIAAGAAAASALPDHYSDGTTFEGPADYGPPTLGDADCDTTTIDPPTYAYATLHYDVGDDGTEDTSDVFPYAYNVPGWISRTTPPEVAGTLYSVTGTWNIGTGTTAKVVVDCRPPETTTTSTPPTTTPPTTTPPPTSPPDVPTVPPDTPTTPADTLPNTGSSTVPIFALGFALAFVGSAVVHFTPARTMTAVEFGQPPEDVKKPAEGDRKFWSVTTLIGALDKPALVYWSANETAHAAVRHVDAWQAIEKTSGTAEAERWIAGARFRVPDGERTAAALGSDVHAAVESYTLTGNRPDVDDEIGPYLDQFDRWAQRWQPEYIATEVTVYAPAYGYAGTCDGFFRLDGVPVIFDIKTSKKTTDKRGDVVGVYPEIALQLAAYRYADMAAVWRPRRFEQFRRRYYLLSEEEQNTAVPVPAVDGGVGLKITPESCTAYPVRCDRDIFEKFLYVVEAARWQFETSKDVIGPALERDDG